MYQVLIDLFGFHKSFSIKLTAKCYHFIYALQVIYTCLRKVIFTNRPKNLRNFSKEKIDISMNLF